MTNEPLSVEHNRRMLIACIGNIFLGDDGFGVEVAQHLMRRRYPANIEVVDFGIRGVDLAYTLLNEYDELILVDTVQRGRAAGTLYLIEPDLSHLTPEQGASDGRIALDAHSMDPLKVLAFALSLGARPIHTLLVGCEPATFGSDDYDDYTEMQMGLSAPVRASIDEAVKMVDSLVEKFYAPTKEPVEKGNSA
jgi:hydrogenase maturation protease